jgi:hypothetical protein
VLAAKRRPGTIMPDQNARLMAFLAVVLALLNAGIYFQREEIVPTMFFMIGAILITVLTRMNVRRNVI